MKSAVSAESSLKYLAQKEGKKTISDGMWQNRNGNNDTGSLPQVGIASSQALGIPSYYA